MKTALVTGGNSGIGFAIAEGLLRAGHRVWIVGRDAQKGAAAVDTLKAHGSVEFLRADLGTAAEVKKFAASFKQTCGGKLDVLVCSTGVLNSKRQLTADGTEETWATQFLCRYLLTEALTPELSASDDGRIVYVGAPLMKSAKINLDDLSLEKGYSMFGAAQQGLLAAHLYQQAYAAAHPKGPTFNSGHVGIVRTGIFRGWAGPMKWMFAIIGPLMAISPERSAKNFVAMATDPALKGVTGYFFPKPEKIAVKNRIELDADKQALFERLRAKL